MSLKVGDLRHEAQPAKGDDHFQCTNPYPPTLQIITKTLRTIRVEAATPSALDERLDTDDGRDARDTGIGKKMRETGLCLQKTAK